MPISLVPVYLNLVCRKFHCENKNCKRKIFTERFSTFIKPYERQTERLREIWVYLAFVLSGEAGHKTCKKLNITLSSDKLINLAKKEDLTSTRLVKEIGIDDFAYKKRHTYGTLICDLKTHDPIDVLDDRDEALEAWLEKHPEINLICRDRSGSYAKIISKKAPQAVSVADRFHLVKNLLDATKDFLKRNIPESIVLEIDEVTKEKSVKAIELNPLKREKEQRIANQKRKKITIRKVKKLNKQGVKPADIARQMALDPKTIRRYLCLDIEEASKYSVTQRKTAIDPFRNFVVEEMKQGKNATEIFKKIREMGFSGSLRSIHRHIQKLKIGGFSSKNEEQHLQLSTSKKKYKHFKRTDLIKKIAKYKEELTSEEHELLQIFFEKSNSVKIAHLLIRKFRLAMKNSDVATLVSWISEAKKSGIDEIKSFANGLEKDWCEVKNAFTLPYNNGLLEGQVNRLKMIKRQMYGRCSFELLRQKVLFRA